MSRATGFNFGGADHSSASSRRADHDNVLFASPRDLPPPVLPHPPRPCKSGRMRTQQPPIRTIVIGRTYRADHDATHRPTSTTIAMV